jgi:hypothetical protein
MFNGKLLRCRMCDFTQDSHLFIHSGWTKLVSMDAPPPVVYDICPECMGYSDPLCPDCERYYSGTNDYTSCPWCAAEKKSA